jgi:pullulanase
MHECADLHSYRRATLLHNRMYSRTSGGSHLCIAPLIFRKTNQWCMMSAVPLLSFALRSAFCVLLLLPSAVAQTDFTDAELRSGYAVRGDTAVFLFDEALYGMSPWRVCVTGSMRGWSQDMNDTAWQLRRASMSGLWLLPLPGQARELSDAQFKFRTEDGSWMPPPAMAVNLSSGNLVFDPQPLRPEYRAEIVAPRNIRFFILRGEGELSLDQEMYEIESAQGQRIAVLSVFRTGRGSVQIFPAEDLDIRRVYYLRVHNPDLRLLCSFDGWMRHTYTPLELGARYHKDRDETIFRIMSPRADSVVLYTYGERTGPLLQRQAMRRNSDGSWEHALTGDMEGVWYDFTVHGPSDPGNEFFEQVPVHISDPWARVNDDSFGRSRVRRPEDTPPPVKGGRPKMEDVIAYEVHVEDFTLALPGLADEKRGSFSGFIQSGLRNSRGDAVGFDYLVDLGINVVHLMPVQEFLHYPDDEWQRAFADDTYMRDQMVSESNYQWGYRTSHAMALESRFRTKGSEHGTQNREFRDLVAAFHEKGIAVIVDLVFNHTAERMDSREMFFHFRALDRHLWYRTGDDLNFIGEYGTETKSEDRPMTARWIYDQCELLVREYGVDGFRIDLAGLTDKQTLLELRRRLGPDVIIYGEPWIASSDPDYEANPDWNWYKEDSPITFFQDDTRNALCGPPDNPRDKKTDRGFAGGNGNREAAKQAIANSFEHEHSPNEGINYLDIHDNWALADRFAERDWNGLLGVEEGPYRIAAAMLLTSLGPVVLHGGSEFMRSKGSAPLVDLIKYTETGPIYIHGKRDTYNLRKPNLFQWETLSMNREDGAACDYKRMADYWKGLIALRKSSYGKVFRIDQGVTKDYIRWIEPEHHMALGYVVGGSVAVAVNTSETPCVIHTFSLPAGSWELVANDERAGTETISGYPESSLKGGTVTLTLPPHSVRIWLRR